MKRLAILTLLATALAALGATPTIDNFSNRSFKIDYSANPTNLITVPLSSQFAFDTVGGVWVLTNAGGLLTNAAMTVGRYPVALTTNSLTDGYFYQVATTNIGFDGLFYWGAGTNLFLQR